MLIRLQLFGGEKQTQFIRNPQMDNHDQAHDHCKLKKENRCKGKKCHYEFMQAQSNTDRKLHHENMKSFTYLFES